jgi:hypothetical protein
MRLMGRQWACRSGIYDEKDRTFSYEYFIKSATCGRAASRAHVITMEGLSTIAGLF